MMNITVNGEQHDVHERLSVATLIEMLQIPRQGIAVATNREIVVRSTWETHVLQHGDVVEIITAAQGG